MTISPYGPERTPLKESLDTQSVGGATFGSGPTSGVRAPGAVGRGRGLALGAEHAVAGGVQTVNIMQSVAGARSGAKPHAVSRGRSPPGGALGTKHAVAGNLQAVRAC